MHENIFKIERSEGQGAGRNEIMDEVADRGIRER